MEVERPNFCREHSLPFEVFCQKIDCPAKTRFGCCKCAGLGVHKKHACVGIARLQQAVRDFQKSNAHKQSKDEELQVYSYCINIIAQQIHQIRARIEKLLCGLEKLLVSDVNARNPSNSMNVIFQINPDNICAVNDADVQNLICKHVLAKGDIQFKN